MAHIRKIDKLLSVLESLNLIKSLRRQTRFYDEPKRFSYNLILENSKRLTDGRIKQTNAGGFSFTSRELALLKCLVEGVERISNTTFKRNNFTFAKFADLKNKAVNPNLYSETNDKGNFVYGWTEGFDLFDDSPYLIPAQTIYYNYHSHEPHHEPLLTEQNSTGAAAGFDKTSTLLRGVYEIIERDAFVSIYLTKSRAPRIDIESLKNQEIQEIYQRAIRYNMDMLLFDITNDLGIPSYLTIIIDKTGLGPVVSLGLKSSLNVNKAILGSMDESFQPRSWMRTEIFKHKDNEIKLKRRLPNTLLDRGLMWLSPAMLKHLDFLINQPAKKIHIFKSTLSSSTEFEKVKDILLKSGYEAFYSDIALKEFQSTGCLVYKITIPRLQPLFLHETHREIKMERLRKVSKYFGEKSFKVNPIPHPFL